MQWFRKCLGENCNKFIYYKSQKSLDGVKTNTLCSSCCHKGNKNGMYNKVPPFVIDNLLKIAA